MRRLLLAASLFTAWAAACGSSEDSSFSDGQSPSSSGDPAGSSGFVDPNGTSGGTSSGSPATSTLKIDPPSATVNATGAIGALTGSVTFNALLDNSPTAVAAKWSVDDVGIGTIDNNGTFKVGQFAGKTTVRAQVGNLQATAEVIVTFKIEEDFTTLDGTDKAKLRAGGSADASFKWLYPYDRTVFPRGLPSPRLQLFGNAPTAFRVYAKSKQLEYEGFYPGGTGAARVTITQDLWKALTQSAKASDPITVSVTKIASGQVTGPIEETWNIAQGSLKGTVFYNSYNSALASTQSGSTGAVMRVKVGSPVEVLIGKTSIGGKDKSCVVCHSVSAQGNRLVAGVDWSTNPVDSASFSISTTGAAAQEYTNAEGRLLPFGALSPDAKYLVGNGISPSGPNLRGLDGTFASKLYDAATGAAISDTYFGGATARYAVTPSFSPDGKLLAFNDKGADSGAHTLALLKFDASASPPVFSGYETLATSANKVVAWPTFTPDGQGVIFHEGDHFDTALHSDGATLGSRYADLKWVNVGATKTVAALDALNGWRKNAGGTLETYLPYGEGEDAHLNYEPTTLPVAVGGYYWVVFTSRRSFGNTIYNGPNSLRAAGDKAFDNGNALGRGYRKKLWIAAIDINGTPGTDISHPAFYLEGQEAEAGNMRGFWALDPCKADGNTCESGDDCCGGFCRQVDQNGTPVKMCVPPPASCSNDTEKCTVDADCCNAAAGTKCIGGYCNQSAPSTPR